MTTIETKTYYKNVVRSSQLLRWLFRGTCVTNVLLESQLQILFLRVSRGTTKGITIKMKELGRERSEAQPHPRPFHTILCNTQDSQKDRCHLSIISRWDRLCGNSLYCPPACRAMWTRPPSCSPRPQAQRLRSVTLREDRIEGDFAYHPALPKERP